MKLDEPCLPLPNGRLPQLGDIIPDDRVMHGKDGVFFEVFGVDDNGENVIIRFALTQTSPYKVIRSS